MSEAPAGTPNGLASLAQKRARRAMPPPRHPSRKPAAAGSSDGGADLESAVQPQQSTVVAAIESLTTERRVAPETASPAAASPVPARPATVYLDELQVNFLERARVAGLLSSPRLDLSKSAVVRLALRRLEEQMSVDEICALLRSQPMDPTRTGRKKR